MMDVVDSSTAEVQAAPPSELFTQEQLALIRRMVAEGFNEHTRRQNREAGARMRAEIPVSRNA